MNKQGAALIALTGFGLGVFVGKGIAAYDSEHSRDAIAPATATAMLPAGHPRVGERDLGDVVTTTLQMSTTPNGRATMPGASSGPSSGAGLPDLLARADELRRQRKFKEATATYRLAANAGAMNADAWADYADALASAGSSLQGAPADALEKALALDPRHPKALWLKASLEHEEHRYKDAVATWRNLLAVVPANSSDARIIEANMAEATRLAAGQG
jgi:tetratricopeptide (TPR) repeat protein